MRRAAFLVMALASACPQDRKEPAADGGTPSAVDGGRDGGSLDAAVAAPDGGVTTTPERFCAEFSARVCAGLVACGCRFDVRSYTAETCVATRTSACVAGLASRVTADIAAGRARFHQPSVSACLAAVETMAAACDLHTTGLGAPLPDACNTIILATATVGTPCQLAGGGLAFCGSRGEGLCVPGETTTTCTALPGEGVACLGGACGEGLVCHGDTCAPPGVVGAPCSSTHGCQAGLVCDPGQHCALPLASGVTCTGSDQCQPGLACDDGTCRVLAVLGDGCRDPQTCGAERSCGRAPETRTCGDRDGPGHACSDGTCAPGLTCHGEPLSCVPLPGDGQPCLDGFYCAEGFTCADGVGTCTALPGLGQPCVMGPSFCAPGLGCRQSDNTCQEPAGQGEDCLINPPDYLCAEGLGCDFGTTGSTCVPVGGPGSPCTNDSTCVATAYCEFSNMTCTTRLADGGACNDGNECLPGHECRVQPGGPRCAPLPGRGEPCAWDCADGLACQGPGGTCVPEFCVMPG